MASKSAPRQWQLTSEESLTSFEAWKENMIYILEENEANEAFLKKDCTWKTTEEDVHHGFTGGEKEKKARQLERMLGQISGYCKDIYSRLSIVKESTHLEDVWNMLKTHLLLHTTGATILGLFAIKLKPGERPENLFQRLKVFVEGNLLVKNSTIKHHNKTLDKDEVLTPLAQNILIVLWLQIINPALPALVEQKYATQLRTNTLASLKPEISMAMKSLLDEIQTTADGKAFRMNVGGFQRRSNQTTFKPKFCSLCKDAKRPYSNHNTFECRFATDNGRRNRYPVRSRALMDSNQEYDQDEYDYQDCPNYMYDDSVEYPSALIDVSSARSVDIMQSPYFNTHYDAQCVRVTLDSGATSSFIKESFAEKLGLPTTPASQKARQADGISSLQVKGETHCLLSRGDYTFQLDALVVDKLDADVLAGMPFLTKNDIAIRPALRQIVVHGCDIIHYGQAAQGTESSIRRAQSFVLSAPAHQAIIMPGEYVELSIPKTTPADEVWAVEPRFDSPLNNKSDINKAWPSPQVLKSVDHHVRLTNDTCEPISLKRKEHLCHVRPIQHIGSHPAAPPVVPSKQTQPTVKSSKPFSAAIALDQDNQLSPSIITKFKDTHIKYDHVFNPEISMYNGASGRIEAVVNMGPTLPPQRKGRLPQYNRETQQELQLKFDELEEAGVFAKPDEVGCVVEYLNISFLVKKTNGGSRLVTSFGEVASYSKPQPSLMPNVDQVIRDIARWQFIIITDLHHAFYQIPLARASRKYCGVSTPYKGTRIYMRSAMGMPGSETYLEELMSRVLGDLVQEGCVAKLADDLYIGGQTADEALYNWERVLASLSRNNLRLSASKTVVCPVSTTILGWVWTQGTLSASPHRVSALSNVKPPTTVHGLRSFIGAFKVLSRVLHGYAELMHPLDVAAAGKSSKDKLVWTDDLLHAFKSAQSALSKCDRITLPHPNDVLWIVTDASVKSHGIGATLYCLRNGDLKLGGYFNAKLKRHQVIWLPCEVEALCISTAVRHFSPYIIQSRHQCHVLTDSKACVQACGKLNRGQFSTSARVTTFLSTLSRYKIHVRHIAGAVNLPSDFTSRNPTECANSSCQVCKFIQECQDSVVYSLTVNDITQGNIRMPFINRVAWLATQHECPDMRRACAHLQQGTRPNKKTKRLQDVKRYINILTVARDGLLVATEHEPFNQVHERIAIPRAVVAGLLTALHIKFNHPSRYQLKQVFMRYFYALDLDRAINRVCSNCHQCEALKSMPPHLHPQTSEPQPDRLGQSYAADVMRRYGQLVLVLRETVTSYTATTFLETERHDDLRDGLIMLVSQMKCASQSSISIRVDSAPGLIALDKDPVLTSHDITLVYGHVKNVNKNPVAEHAIQELGRECLQLQPEGGRLSRVTLALATANMNSRIRHTGLSAAELWTQRDQITGEQLAIDDSQVILKQQANRAANHPYSMKSKSGNRHGYGYVPLRVGDLVYLKHDRDKTKARDKYMIASVTDNKCCVRKFVKNQFRAKSYDVLLCDCYPITSTVFEHSPHRPIRGLAQVSSSDESDIDDDPPQIVPPRDDEEELPDPHAGRPPDMPEVPIPGEINRPLEPALPADNAPLNQLPQPLRRSTRARRPNTYLNDGSWTLSDSSDTDSQ